MKLITKELQNRLPKLGETENEPDPVVQAKFFYPDFTWTWYAIEYDPETERCFGLVNGFVRELGYFSLEELRENTGKMGLPIERDRYFKPLRLSELQEKLKKGEHV